MQGFPRPEKPTRGLEPRTPSLRVTGTSAFFGLIRSLHGIAQARVSGVGVPVHVIRLRSSSGWILALRSPIARLFPACAKLPASAPSAVLTGAVAERFLATRIEEGQEEVVEEVERAEADVLSELREITERLHALERTLGAKSAG